MTRPRFLRAGPAALTTLTLVAASTIALLVQAAIAGPASATPGTPKPPVVLSADGFENGTGLTPVPLEDYTGPAPLHQTYTADTPWLIQCNGTIVEFASPESDQAASGCAQDSSYGSVRQLAQALGQFNGSPDPSTNHALTAFTEGNPGADQVQLQTVQGVPVPATGRYLGVRVDVAVANCFANHPLLEFALIQGATVLPLSAAPTDPCSGTDTITVPATGVVGPLTTIVGSFAGDSSVLFTGGGPVQLRLVNAQGSGFGNDFAVDNLTLLDETPQLDKSFQPTTILSGGSSTLTLTVTNTSELAAKSGFGFTDALPAGLSIGSGPVRTDCGDGVLTAPAGATRVVLAGGDLHAGQAACTVTVPVTATTGGTYTNGPDNLSLTGLDAPAPATLTVRPTATVQVTKQLSGPRVNAHDQFQVALRTGSGSGPILAAGTTTGAGSTVTPGTGTTGVDVVPVGPTYYVTEASAGTTNLAFYDATITCTDANGRQGGLPSGTAFSGTVAITPVEGAAISCVITNGSAPQSYTVSKQASPTSAVPGQVVNYAVTVTNTGPVAYTRTALMFFDDLSDVADDASYVDGSATASSGVTFAQDNAVSWAGPLAVGASVVVRYQVRVHATDGGDHLLVNSVTPTASGGRCAGAGQCVTRTPVQSAAVSKTVSAGSAKPGQSLTYTLRIVNTGQVAYTDTNPATLTDDLSGVLDDATYLAGTAAATAGSVQIVGSTLTWNGPVPVGATVTVTYRIRIDDVDRGDGVLHNAVVPSGPGTGCQPAAACVSVGPPSYLVDKTADLSGPVSPGQLVTYTLTVVNTGRVGYTAAHPARLRDDLAGVLDDATFVGVSPAVAGVVFDPTARTLSWSGPLPIGGPAVVIRYQVRVADVGTGDGQLRNSVTTPDGLSTCPAGTQSSGCVVVNAITSVAGPTAGAGGGSASGSGRGGSTTNPLAVTGVDSLRLLQLAALCLGAGAVALAAGRWRSRRR